jgi:hypothetical protein
MLSKSREYLHLDNVLHALDHFEYLELSAELIANFLNSLEGTLAVGIFVFGFKDNTWGKKTSTKASGTDDSLDVNIRELRLFHYGDGTFLKNLYLTNKLKFSHIYNMNLALYSRKSSILNQCVFPFYIFA